jgi:hypothetical protein
MWQLVLPKTFDNFSMTSPLLSSLENQDLPQAWRRRTWCPSTKTEQTVPMTEKGRGLLNKTRSLNFHGRRLLSLSPFSCFEKRRVGSSMLVSKIGTIFV